MVLVLVVLACGGATSESSRGGLRVISSVTQVSALVRAVGGDRVRLTPLLTSRDDPHQFEMRPEQVSRLSQARVVFASGAGADRWLETAAASAGVSARMVRLSDRVRLRRGTGVDASGPDPHWWYDVDNAAAATDAIAAALTAADPAGGDVYHANAAAEKQRLADADGRIHTLIDPVPPERRLFVANHDAFNYFLDRYGIKLVGDIIPSTDGVSAVRPADVAALVAAIRTLHVCAVFTETTIDSRLAAQIASEGHVKVFAGSLYGDAIGDPGSEGATLERALVHNARLMASAFGSC